MDTPTLEHDRCIFAGYQLLYQLCASSLFYPYIFRYAALESLGFGSYIAEVKDVLQECKTVALKRRKASSRLENLGIPEEELLRQQQELFAKVSYF